MITVSVKWQKEFFQNVEVNTSEPPFVFKCQLYDLTGVLPERQKVMIKGGLVKDDADWQTTGIKQGQMLMMMGTTDEIVKPPEKGPIFMEDLPEEEQVAHVGNTAGLKNLGNTCYMNATVQCLHSIPELKYAVAKYPLGQRSDPDRKSHALAIATHELFSDLDTNVNPIEPLKFWMALREKYPQFAQTHNEFFMQQDAEECWTQLLYALSQSFRLQSASNDPDVVKELFGIELKSRIHCQESGEESTETELVFSLKCHISHEVNHLQQGLKHGLKSELEKTSPVLEHSAVYTKESRINSLPKYLTVQFVRFFWKRESNQKAKILRKVDYPLELDVHELCSDDLSHKLQLPRMESAGGRGESTKGTSDEGQSSMDKNIDFTGIYDLVAVLTHKGRSADSGHYVAWVKQESGNWIEFDDEYAIPRVESDIARLSGGGDWHMAYICMYKARNVVV